MKSVKVNEDTRAAPGVFIVNFEQILKPFPRVLTIHLEQVNAHWVVFSFLISNFLDFLTCNIWFCNFYLTVVER